LKIFNTHQIQEWDAYSIKEKKISSIDLMENASIQYVQWLENLNLNKDEKILIICGTGNNGGDGLAIARILSRKFYDVSICIIGDINKGSTDFILNLQRIKKVKEIKKFTFEDLVKLNQSSYHIIDAIFGSGLNKTPQNIHADAIEWINKNKIKCYSIDCPSGLFLDKLTNDNCVNADYTGTFGCQKLAFMFPENEKYVGKWSVINIGLSKEYYQNTDTKYNLISKYDAIQIIKPRPKHSHKGTFGHGLLIAGSKNMPGAAVLSGKACISSGIGKLTLSSSSKVLTHIINACPEIITHYRTEKIDYQQYDFIGIGPGLGEKQKSKLRLVEHLDKNKPLLLDADALNIIAYQGLQNYIPRHSILTPHLKEFERLFGQQDNSYQSLETQINRSIEQQIYIVKKSHHTITTTPNGQVYFNNSGNNGLASAGTGDVLFGIILSLLCQGYTSEEACILGVYWHGNTADLLSNNIAVESITASKIIDYLGESLLNIKSF
jgi:NAD(P)H-hydrate epimerase